MRRGIRQNRQIPLRRFPTPEGYCVADRRLQRGICSRCPESTWGVQLSKRRRAPGGNGAQRQIKSPHSHQPCGQKFVHRLPVTAGAQVWSLRIWLSAACAHHSDPLAGLRTPFRFRLPFKTGRTDPPCLLSIFIISYFFRFASPFVPLLFYSFFNTKLTPA